MGECERRGRERDLLVGGSATDDQDDVKGGQAEDGHEHEQVQGQYGHGRDVGSGKEVLPGKKETRACIRRLEGRGTWFSR